MTEKGASSCWVFSFRRQSNSASDFEARQTNHLFVLFIYFLILPKMEFVFFTAIAHWTKRFIVTTPTVIPRLFPDWLLQVQTSCECEVGLWVVGVFLVIICIDLHLCKSNCISCSVVTFRKILLELLSVTCGFSIWNSLVTSTNLSIPLFFTKSRSFINKLIRHWIHFHMCAPKKACLF